MRTDTQHEVDPFKLSEDEVDFVWNPMRYVDDTIQGHAHSDAELLDREIRHLSRESRELLATRFLEVANKRVHTYLDEVESRISDATGEMCDRLEGGDPDLGEELADTLDSLLEDRVAHFGCH